MNFGEALLLVLSFFWSPIFVALLLLFGVLVGLGILSEGIEWDEPATAVGGALLGVISLLPLIALIISAFSGGILPFNWSPVTG